MSPFVESPILFLGFFVFFFYLFFLLISIYYKYVSLKDVIYMNYFFSYTFFTLSAMHIFPPFDTFNLWIRKKKH